MTRLVVLALAVCSCAFSTDSFRDKGSGGWVKDEPFTTSELDRDIAECRADSYQAEVTRDENAGVGEPVYFPMMRSRQSGGHCLRERGWHRESEPARPRNR